MNSKISLLVTTLFFCILSAYSHGDLHERIERISKEILKKPDSAYLYFKRGKLLYQHEDFNSSIKDLQKSSDLGYVDIEQKLLLSNNYYRIGEYNKALVKIDDLLIDDSKNVVFLKLKARIFLKQNKYEMAALSFQSVIDNSSKTFPENYIECAEAWAKLKTDNGYRHAIKVLDLGIDNLGQVISLFEKKVELFSEYSDYESAVLNQQQIVDILNRKEYAYYKLAELNFKNNDLVACQASLQHAKTSIDKLPNRIRNTKNITDLISQINNLEQNIN